jgi:hypothetical protein
VSVRAARLDSLIGSGEVSLDGLALVWLDAQGHEAQILEGAASLLDAGVPIAIEYWPYGLRRAGGLERLHALIAERMEHVIDLNSAGAGGPRVLAARELPELEARNGWGGDAGRDATDLLLAPVIGSDWRPI